MEVARKPEGRRKTVSPKARPTLGVEAVAKLLNAARVEQIPKGGTGAPGLPLFLDMKASSSKRLATTGT
jgi:hypothetical protein